MSVECIRKLTRYLASGTLVGFFALVFYGLARHQPLHHHDLWGALGCTLVVTGFWGLFELLPLLTDRAVERIISAQPDARTLVARTVEAYEQDQEQVAAAGLTRIGIGRQRR